MARSRKKQVKTNGGRSRSIKILLALLVFGGFGAGMYFAGQAQLFQPHTKVDKIPKPFVVVQKPIASKPKRAFGAVLANRGSSNAENFKYTYLDILDDTGMNLFVDLRGNIVDKTLPVKMNQTRVKKTRPPAEPAKVPANIKTLPVAPAKAPGPSAKIKKARPSPSSAIKNHVPAIKKSIKKKRPPVLKETVPAEKGTQWVLSSLSELKEQEKGAEFWVQVASFKKLGRAKGLEEQLGQKGFFPFIRQIEIQGKGNWYRVYLGRYPSRQIASRYQEMARNKLKLNPVVVPAG